MSPGDLVSSTSIASPSSPFFVSAWSGLFSDGFFLDASSSLSSLLSSFRWAARTCLSYSSCACSAASRRTS